MKVREEISVPLVSGGAGKRGGKGPYKPPPQTNLMKRKVGGSRAEVKNTSGNWIEEKLDMKITLQHKIRCSLGLLCLLFTLSRQ